jgi:hypothetical protein
LIPPARLQLFHFIFNFIFVRSLLPSLGMLLTAAAAIAATGVSRDDTEIQGWLTRHAQRAHSIELAATRHRVVGDLDGDGRDDVAVLYTLQPRVGRRGESRYLAVFTHQRDPAHEGRRDGLRYRAHVLVSGPGAGEANRATILERSVVVEMLIFGPGDASCCPTRPATRRYRLTAQGLALIQHDRAKRAR